MNIRTALQQGTRLLDEGAVPSSRLTAEILLCHAAGCERTRLYSHPEEDLTESAWIHYGRYLHERLNGKPTQYITAKQEFYGRQFRVTPDVLIPRPETEHVVETVLERARNARTMLDIGCGSGAIAVTLRLETGAQVFGTDVSEAALRVAARNAERLGARVELVICDLGSALSGASFDVVASNPPYVPDEDVRGLQREVRDWEPHVALFGGASGLEFYGRLVAEAARLLRPGGLVALELGFKTAEAVRRMLDGRWKEVELIPDLAGIPRVAAARYWP